MKLCSARLERGGVQAKPGRLMGTIDASGGHSLLLISNLRCIKIEHGQWAEPVYVPIEKFDCFSPLLEDK